MQVILDSSFARPGSAPIWGGKKGEFRDFASWAIDPQPFLATGLIVNYNIASRATQSKSVYVSVLKLTNVFHVAVRLFSNRSQMTSKCGKNKKVTHEV